MLSAYNKLVQQGVLRNDTQQLRVAQKLQLLLEQLHGYAEKVENYNASIQGYTIQKDRLAQEIQRDLAEQHKQQSMGFWQRWTTPSSTSPAAGAAALRSAVDQEVLQRLGPPPVPPSTVPGLYIWGSVGSGKSLLMDLFYSQAQSQQLLPYTQRLHFNAALLQVHSALGQLEKERQQHEERQAAEYAAKVAALQAQQAAALEAAVDAEVEGQRSGFPSLPWLQLRKLDPGYQRQKRALLARLAVRREQRDRMARDPNEHMARLAASNSHLVQIAAVSLLTGQACGGFSSAAAQQLLSKRVAALLCFDELQVGDPFNAVAIKGMLEWLFGSGGLMVSTSNRPPWELNRHGLQEDLFDHLIHTLLQHCEVVELSAQTDYRRQLQPATLAKRLQQQLQAGSSAETSSVQPDMGSSGSYHYPLGPAADAALEHAWRQLVSKEGQPERSITLPVHFGRTLQVPRACGRAAWFRFADLCAANLAAPDYMALTQHFDTLVLSDVPAMSLKIRDQARRFIVLVDELYNARCRLVCSAEVAPDSLFAGTATEEPLIDLEALQFETEAEGSKLRRNLLADGGVAPVAGTKATLAAAQALLGGAEEKFMFARAVSRLHEMQSTAYMAGRHPVQCSQQVLQQVTNLG